MHVPILCSYRAVATSNSETEDKKKLPYCIDIMLKTIIAFHVITES